MKKTLIFSDVHLKATPDDKPRHREFVEFLRGFATGDYDRLVCLGDLFDFWFEYRHSIFYGYFEVLRALAELRDAGLSLHLICGNHDFWAGSFLEQELGFQVHREAVVLPFGEKRVHFLHGDGVNPADRGYRVYKRFARNGVIIRMFRLLHPDWAMALAQGVSHGSRTMLQEADPANGAEAKALAAYAREVISRGEAEVVMCGHAHAPTQQVVANGTAEGLYINTGDWLVNRSYVVWDGENFTLHDLQTDPR